MVSQVSQAFNIEAKEDQDGMDVQVLKMQRFCCWKKLLSPALSWLVAIQKSSGAALLVITLHWPIDKCSVGLSCSRSFIGQITSLLAG